MTAVASELAAIVGEDAVLAGGATRPYRNDATEAQGLEGEPAAVALPSTAEQVADVVRWCYDHDVAVVPRGGGTGFAGGCVPVGGEVVISLERLTRVRSFDPELWRMEVEAGLTTAAVRRLARENGLFFPPDPGAAEQSQIGGNVATNAGGPHAFKYGVTGHYVTGVEAIVAPGELVRVGGPIRKDVAGYDLRGLLVGSEGTLGIVTAAWLRLIPAPEAAAPVIAAYADADAGCAGIAAVLGSGIVPAALELLDDGTLAAARAAYPFGLPEEAAFMVIAEADGSEADTTRTRDELVEVLGEGALAVHAPASPREVADLWRWRDGVSSAVEADRGGKVSEDIVVPVDRLADAVRMTTEIGARHGLPACTWGHAGDGNLHSTFLVDPRDPAEVARAHAAAHELYREAARLGGSISGEHGIGWVKRGQLGLQWPLAAVELHAAIKRTLDPKGLLNPGKKT